MRHVTVASEAVWLLTLVGTGNSHKIRENLAATGSQQQIQPCRLCDKACRLYPYLNTHTHLQRPASGLLQIRMRPPLRRPTPGP